MGKSAGSAPASVDYASLIPLQTQANKDIFNYTLGQSRVNTNTPYGSSTWSRTPSFDQTGYDAAMARWQQGGGVPPPSYQPPIMPSPSGPWNDPNHRMHILEGADGAVPGDPGVGTGDGANGGAGNGAAGPSFPWGSDTPNNPGLPSDPTSGSVPSSPGAMPLPGDYTSYNWTNTQTLSPEQQKLYEGEVGNTGAQQDIIARILGQQGGQFGRPLDTSGLSSWGDRLTAGAAPVQGIATTAQDRASGLQNQIAQYLSKINGMDPLAINQQASDAVYNSASRYLDPQYKQQQSQLEARLAEQGFVPGTPAYQQAMDQFGQGRERAYADARDRATQLGASVGRDAFSSGLAGIQQSIAGLMSGANFGAAQDTNQFGQNLQAGQFANNVAQGLFDRNLSAGTFNNSLHQQQLAQLLTERQQPLNELNSLRTGAMFNPPNLTPGSAGTPNLQAPNALDAANQQQQQNLTQYNANVGAANSQNQLYGSLATALAMYFSDPRLKKDVVRIGTTPGGVPTYEWTYVWGGPRTRGVMAPDVPHAAVLHESGYWMVDYSKVL